MNRFIYQEPKTVYCEIYKKQMTIYLNVIEYNGKRYIDSNGCENSSGHPKCYECKARQRCVLDI